MSSPTLRLNSVLSSVRLLLLGVPVSLDVDEAAMPVRSVWLLLEGTVALLACRLLLARSVALASLLDRGRLAPGLRQFSDAVCSLYVSTRTTVLASSADFGSASLPSSPSACSVSALLDKDGKKPLLLLPDTLVGVEVAELGADKEAAEDGEWAGAAVEATCGPSGDGERLGRPLTS